MFPMCLGGSKKVKLLNFENDACHQVMRNLFAAKAAVRIIRAKSIMPQW